MILEEGTKAGQCLYFIRPGKLKAGKIDFLQFTQLVNGSTSLRNQVNNWF